MKKNLPIGNAQYINHLNKVKVLNLIKESNEISRAELVAQSHLSAPTITRIVDSLINNEKLAIQVGLGNSHGGRRPKMIKFNGDNNYIIGVDWGRTHIHGILTNLHGHTLAELDVKTEVIFNTSAQLNEVYDLIDQLISESNIDKTKLFGIGVAVAGFVNKDTNLIEYSPNFKWKNINLGLPIMKRFNVPVIIDNVSRVMALGELHYGIGSQFKNYVFVNVGYGIGCGIIVNGAPLYGFDGISGEIGHTKVMTNETSKRICSCGKSDCLECYSSGRGIAEIAAENIHSRQDSILFQEYQKSNITAEIVAKAALADDQFALELYHQAALYLGSAIANLANTINPECIILGGKVAGAGKFFFSKILESFEREKLQQPSRTIQLLPTKLGHNAAAKGAIALILNEILNLNVKSIFSNT
ncbi:ROK family protein [Puteibacter caeruleilacunae]|nr:ROK family protein [Puteibacter caeruleilacunae]